MVAHHHLGAAGVDHGTDDLERLDLLGSTIDEIANKDRLALLTGSCVPLGATTLLVPEFSKQSFELVGAAVDVSNDVKTCHEGQFPTRK